jgi:hypothetical protein
MSYSDSKLKSLSKRAKSHLPSTLSHLPNYFTGKHNAVIDIMEDPEYFRVKKGRSFIVVNMNAEQYFDALDKAVPGEHWMIEGPKVESRVGEYSTRMINGEKADNPYIQYSFSPGFFDPKPSFSFGQEGRHRMLAARKAGQESVPVFVVYDTRHLNEIIPHMTDQVKNAILYSESC